MTRRFFRQALRLFTLVLVGGPAWCGLAHAGPTNPAPDFKEVYDLLRANLPGATDNVLNRAAVAGLMARFPGKIAILGAPGDGGVAGPQIGLALGKAVVIENNVLYFRISRVAESLPGELKTAGRILAATNKVVGAVLDLRFAGGDDYAAAQKTAELWAPQNISRPATGPVVVLINGETCGAAEALVAALRKASGTLAIGSPTAGAALTFKEFPLKDGERLLIATTPVKIDGQALPSDGLKPDIAMTVDAAQERVLFENPYGILSAKADPARAVSNRFLPFVDRTSEADLVRQRQQDGRSLNAPGLPDSQARRADDDGDSADDSPPAHPAEPSKPVLSDPVLARGVDLVKGLAVVREAHP